MSIKRELRVFLLVGLLTVSIDLVSYRLLMWLGVSVSPAKATSFIIGTVFAYFANKQWTFDSAEGGRKRFFGFALLYSTTLAINVLVNAVVLHFLGVEEFALAAGFLSATATSATLNFLGMKFLVFKKPPLPGEE